MEAIAKESNRYQGDFLALDSERGRETAGLRALRRDAFARFQDLGFPTAKLEAWKYTNLSPVTERNWAPAADLFAGPPLSEAALRGWKIPGATELVFVNGRFSEELSGPVAPQTGLQVTSLAHTLAREPEKLEAWLGRPPSPEAPAFAAWNTAFFEDGALIEIAPGAVLGAPIHLLFVTAEEETPAVSSPRILIVAGSGSQATVVETYAGDGAVLGLTNSVTEVFVADGAVLEHYNVQQESPSTRHIHAIGVRQERASSFTSHNVATGSALARTDINVLFADEGSECALNGLFLTSGTQHVDNHTLIDHAKPHCTSRELYKGILDGRSRGVFHGKIIVRPDAQKTDAIQTNKNLLLSREALVNSTPALEILADDVKCRHGSTIGQLDANALFYLRSRGIGEREARALLTYGFAADLARRIRVPRIRERIEAFLGLRLPQPAEEP